ncbi:hypothetical protein ACLB1G_15585 [Oxalobacteraceae bacterium A2-2]
MKTDSPLPLKAAGLLLALALAGCASKPAVQAAAKPKPAPAPTPPVVVVEKPPLDPLPPLLAYHQSLRRMSQGELLKELSSLNQQPRGARVSMQTAMALMLTRASGDMAKAQALLDGVAASGEAEAGPYKALAQVLSSSCAEARRLAEHNDKLAAQLRDNQKRTDQLSETVEALKAIERNLPARSAVPAQQVTK